MRFMEWAAYAVLCLALCMGTASFWIGLDANRLMYTEPPDYTTDRTDEFVSLKQYKMSETFFQFAVVTGIVGGFMLVGARTGARKRKKGEDSNEAKNGERSESAK